LSGTESWLLEYLYALLSVESTLIKDLVHKIMRKFALKQLLFLVALCVSIGVKAQYRGVILDAGDNSPLPGAVISTDGSTTMSNSDGSWSINAAEGSELTASFVGYTSQTITLGSNKNIEIRLVYDRSASTLDEVVVVGFGTQKKSNVTGAISSVKSEDLEDLQLPRIETALQGRTSGVSVVQSSGQPGAGAVIRIRGTSSINGSDPLYVVDGVVIGGGIDFLNPGDIETIEVLKDAASAAIYGARGANGVIIVTTKNGSKARGMEVKVTSYTGVQNPWKKIPVLNGTEYATLMNEMAAAAGQPTLYEDPLQYGAGTDWQSHVFNQNAIMQNSDISIAGSTDRGSYYASLSNFNQEGIVAEGKSYYERLAARLNTITHVNDKLTVGWNVAYTHNQSNGVAENTEWGSPLGRALNMDPLTPLYETNATVLSSAPYSSGGVLRSNLVRDANGIFGISNRVTSEIVNPVAAYSIINNYGWADKIVNNTYAEFEILPGLKARSSMGIDLAFWGNEGFTPSHYLNATNLLDTNNVYSSFNRGFTWIWDNTLTYSHSVGKHNLNYLAGHSAQEVNGRYIGGNKRDVPTQDFQDATIDYARNEISEQVYGGKWERYAIESYFGRANYDYDGKYVATAILRADASSRFGSNYRWGYFPSLSAGWNIHKEDFWIYDNINQLKLKAGYGLNGSDAAGSLEYASTIIGGRSYTFGRNEILTNGTTPAQVANPDLRWESVAQLNVGAEIRAFDYFVFGLDVFNRRTNDMKTRPPLPSYIGNDPSTANVGSMLNQGIDMEFGYDRAYNQDFSIGVSGNVSFIKNEVVLIGNDAGYLTGAGWGPQGLEITRITEGLPIGYLFGYQTDGVFQNMDDVYGYTSSEGDTIQPGAKPGDFRFVDINGDGEITADDRTMIGNPTPDWTAGITVDMSYKNWDLNVFGQGVFGNDIYNATRRYDLPTSNMPATAIDRWTGEGSTDTHPRLTFDDRNKNFARSSDFYVEDGSFFRLKSLQLGYTLTGNFAESIGLRKMRIYYAGTNLLTFTKYSGFDPEIGAGMGVDRGIYPQARVNTIGVNITFK
jgi:TonB-linked SusC/RagA family outer membrane protein